MAQIARLFEVLWSAPQEGGAWTGADSDWQTENSPPMPECLGRHRPSRGRRRPQAGIPDSASTIRS
jgi:hypothetical protein